MKTIYVPIAIKDRLPDLSQYYNDKLILLDEQQDIYRTVNVGLFTEWDAVKGNAAYWLEKQEINTTEEKPLPIQFIKEKFQLSEDYQLENPLAEMTYLDLVLLADEYSSLK